MATTAAATGTVVLVDAALAPYEHPDLRWLIRKHVLPVLEDFPTLSLSVDTYTSDSGASTVLLNARGLLTVSSALPPVLLTLWLPREYPYLPPLAYVFPAAPSSASLSLDGERWRTDLSDLDRIFASANICLILRDFLRINRHQYTA
ncbi:protein ELC-like [Miscanthus floridulus]|uniref:protein ELC-like n=1 Tax=Miscanthus floridulus TaxID=154761 RepID=UPI00345895F1